MGHIWVTRTIAVVTEPVNHPDNRILQRGSPDGQAGIAVVNFPPKRVAGVNSEVLVLAAVSESRGTVLLEPTFPVENGTQIA
jgi:hypothetical protein